MRLETHGEDNSIDGLVAITEVMEGRLGIWHAPMSLNDNNMVAYVFVGDQNTCVIDEKIDASAGQAEYVEKIRSKADESSATAVLLMFLLAKGPANTEDERAVVAYMLQRTPTGLQCGLCIFKRKEDADGSYSRLSLRLDALPPGKLDALKANAARWDGCLSHDPIVSGGDANMV